MNERDRCIANLYALAKRKGIKIGELETSCGVSIGYLARLRQDKKKPFPGFDFLFHAAGILEVTLDALMYFDFQLATETDQYLHAFISRMILDTLTEKLAWGADPACLPDPAVLEGERVFPAHPLLSLEPNLLQEGKSKQIYSSPFHPAAYHLVPRAAWRAALSEDVTVFLTKVADIGESGEENGEENAELYLYNMKETTLSPLCCQHASHPGLLDHDLAVLCETVAESLHRTALDQHAVSAIDAYLRR